MGPIIKQFGAQTGARITTQLDENLGSKQIFTQTTAYRPARKVINKETQIDSPESVDQATQTEHPKPEPLTVKLCK